MDERIRRLNEDLERDLEAHDDEGGAFAFAAVTART